MGVVVNKVKDQLEEGFQDPDVKARWDEIDPGGELRQTLLEDEMLLEAIIEGSYKFDSDKHWMVGKIPTEEGLNQYSDKLIEIAHQNGGSLGPLLESYKENPEATLKMLERADFEGLAANLQPEELENTTEVLAMQEPVESEQNALHAQDSQFPAGEGITAVVLSSDPKNPVIAELSGIDPNVSFINAQTGLSYNLPQPGAEPDISEPGLTGIKAPTITL